MNFKQPGPGALRSRENFIPGHSFDAFSLGVHTLEIAMA